LFSRVEDAGEDGALVTILHIQPARRKPMSQTEAEDIRGGALTGWSTEHAVQVSDAQERRGRK
jgi:hypothetical protein